ncbi:MAG: hypothetical protein NTW86_22410 [Candidatus Sumerlaeota bacterium]|nr:hypothetical protein [Candidatus Sumerlaeota bacterium]
MKLSTRLGQRWAQRVCLCAVLCIAASATAAEVNRAIFPSKPFIFIALRDVDGMKANFGQTPVAKMWADPALNPLRQAFSKAGEDLKAAIEAANPEARRGLVQARFAAELTGQTLSDLKDLSFALYMKSAEGEAKPKPPEPEFGLAIQVGGPTLERLKKTIFSKGLAEESFPAPWPELDQKTQEALDKGWITQEDLPNGATLLQAAGKDKGAVALAGDWLYLANNAAGVKAAASGQPVAGGVDPMAEALGDKAKEPAFFFAENLVPMWAMLDQMEKTLSQASPGQTAESAEAAKNRMDGLAKLRMVRELEHRLGVTAIDSMFFRYSFGADGFHMHFELNLNPNEPVGFMYRGPNHPFEIGKWAPAGITSAAEAYMRPLGDLWSDLREGVQAIGGVAWTSILDSLLAQARTKTGIDLEKDVFANLGGHFLTWSARAAMPFSAPAASMGTAAAAASLFGLGAGGALPPAVMAIEVKDDKAILQSVDRLVAAAPAGWALSAVDHSEGPAPYKTVASMLSFFGLQPAYGAIDGFFVFATSAEAFETAAKAHAAGGDAGSRAAIEKALKEANLKNEGIQLAYSDPRDSLRSLPKLGALMSFGTPFLVQADAAQVKTPAGQEILRVVGASAGAIGTAFSQLNPEPLASHLFPSVKVARMEGDNKMVMERRSSLPEEIVALGVGGGIAGVVAVKAFQEAKAKAERAKAERAAQKAAEGAGSQPAEAPKAPPAKESERMPVMKTPPPPMPPSPPASRPVPQGAA